MTPRSDARRPSVVPALALAALAISFAAIFFRNAAPTPPLAAAGIRLVIAALLLSPFVVRARRAGRLPNAHLRVAAVAGVAYAVHFGAWVASLGLTSVAASVTLVTASPLFLAIVGLATGRDRPGARVLAGLSLGIVGLAVVGWSDLAHPAASPLGDALALLGAMAMAAYLLLVRRLGPAVDVLAVSGVAVAVGAALLALAAMATGTPFAPASWEALAWLAAAALAPQLIGHTLLTWALAHTTPTIVGVATLAEPVGAAFLAWALLDEAAPAWTIVGCAVTIAGVALALTRRRAIVAPDPQPGSRP